MLWLLRRSILKLLFSGPMFSVLFFIPMALLEGKSFGSSVQEFNSKFPTVYLVDWLLWVLKYAIKYFNIEKITLVFFCSQPPCQLVNFYLVPATYRVLYVNSATVLWNVFLSYMKHYDQY